jgi:hypothetical protein
VRYIDKLPLLVFVQVFSECNRLHQVDMVSRQTTCRTECHEQQGGIVSCSINQNLKLLCISWFAICRPVLPDYVRKPAMPVLAAIKLLHD